MPVRKIIVAAVFALAMSPGAFADTDWGGLGHENVELAQAMNMGVQTRMEDVRELRTRAAAVPRDLPATSVAKAAPTNALILMASVAFMLLALATANSRKRWKTRRPLPYNRVDSRDALMRDEVQPF